MAFQHNLNSSDNNLAVDFIAAYTVVADIEILKQPVYIAPSGEGGEPGIASTHTIKFTTRTFVNKDASTLGKGPIAEHNYIEPYSLTTSTDNVIAYCYNWLSENVTLFDSATSV